MKKWHGLMKIVEAEQIRDGKVLWREENIRNTFHAGGELFMLTCSFDNDGTFPPEQYYIGLDNRSSVTVEDLMTDLVDEPSGNGYVRQSISSNGGFTIDLLNSVYVATSNILTFSASVSSGYGPISTMFITNKSDNTGILLATATFSSPFTLSAGDIFNTRINLSLQDGGD